MTDTLRSMAETRGIGGIMLLFATVSMGLLLAYVARGFHGVLYVPLVTPCALGWALGLVLARVCLRYQLADAVPAVTAAVLGGVILYTAYHALVYDRVIAFMVSQLASFADSAASSPVTEVHRFLAQETGEQGFLAYLAFVSQGEHGAVHPLGMLGGLRPGLTGTLVAMGIELGALVVTAAWVTRRRGRGVAAHQPDGSRVREVIAHTDGATLRAAMEAMDRGDFEAAGRVLRRPDVEDTFAVALVYSPYTADDYRLEILEGDRVRAERSVSSWDGQALWDALRVR